MVFSVRVRIRFGKSHGDPDREGEGEFNAFLSRIYIFVGITRSPPPTPPVLKFAIRKMFNILTLTVAEVHPKKKL